ncbi:hypothetical protein [Salinibaculum rarum]|uniref:hypothetical protein n=1 Tax=Salinibaculum rarum TaxID=3058903 RepID=UPI00265F2110|nr:hypothetical protein [Salinibaculum sp. KK48]
MSDTNSTDDSSCTVDETSDHDTGTDPMESDDEETIEDIESLIGDPIGEINPTEVDENDDSNDASTDSNKSRDTTDSHNPNSSCFEQDSTNKTESPSSTNENIDKGGFGTTAHTDATSNHKDSENAESPIDESQDEDPTVIDPRAQSTTVKSNSADEQTVTNGSGGGPRARTRPNNEGSTSTAEEDQHKTEDGSTSEAFDQNSGFDGHGDGGVETTGEEWGFESELGDGDVTETATENSVSNTEDTHGSTTSDSNVETSGAKQETVEGAVDAVETNGNTDSSTTTSNTSTSRKRDWSTPSAQSRTTIESQPEHIQGPARNAFTESSNRVDPFSREPSFTERLLRRGPSGVSSHRSSSQLGLSDCIDAASRLVGGIVQVIAGLLGLAAWVVYRSAPVIAGASTIMMVVSIIGVWVEPVAFMPETLLISQFAHSALYIVVFGGIAWIATRVTYEL